jgi:phosphopantothenoylcysteine decarboxylase/phosphopantothenate--cysteine ligase
MGVLLAQAARLRGASVDLIHGPLAVDPAWLEGLRCHPISTGAELQQRLGALQPHATAIAMAAAVADHRPARPQAGKLEKSALAEAMAAGWQEVPDLLQQLVAHRPAGQRILGFAAQSGDGLKQARLKFVRKGCDLLFANPIDRPGAGFGSSTNEGWLLGPGDRCQTVAPASKLAIAHQLLTALLALGPTA